MAAPSIVNLQRADSDTGHERIRREELKLASRWIRPGSRVLEIGGGSGFQAALLAAGGCDVVTIDVVQHSPQALGFQKQYWPVALYDGRHFPCGDGEFDVVYSSHMLHHVAQRMPEFLAEVQRVLRPGGVTVHVVPSASWRWWTNLAYYVDLLRRVWFRMTAKRPASGGRTGPPGTVQPTRLATRFKRLLFPPPVGCGTNTISQLMGFRRARWVAGFRQAGWGDVKSIGSGLFYTGYLFFPSLPIPVRGGMAKLLGSSSHLVFSRPPEPEVERPAGQEMKRPA
jgi:SAM-dependent methyltransferase